MGKLLDIIVPRTMRHSHIISSSFFNSTNIYMYAHTYGHNAFSP